jgi:hypothetical protein
MLQGKHFASTAKEYLNNTVSISKINTKTADFLLLSGVLLLINDFLIFYLV